MLTKYTIVNLLDIINTNKIVKEQNSILKTITFKKKTIVQ